MRFVEWLNRSRFLSLRTENRGALFLQLLYCSFIALTISSVTFLASPSSIIVPSL